MNPKYKSVLLKLSGEAMLPAGESSGVSIDAANNIVSEVAPVIKSGVKVALVIGGGNIFRGAAAAATGKIGRAQADTMGMLATVINALALQEAFERAGLETSLMTNLALPDIAEPFFHRNARDHLDKGRVVILAGGTGRPSFSTDTAASLTAVEIGAEVLMKGTKVDGVYSADPVKDPKAKRYEKLTYMDALTGRLAVMDSTAISMCMDRNLPIIVFNFFKPGEFQKVVSGANIGTVVYG
jgi:uridylate kinase